MMELYKDPEPVKTEVQLFGERLERLGKAFQDQDTPMTVLASMAMECGFYLKLGLERIEVSEESND